MPTIRSIPCIHPRESVLIRINRGLLPSTLPPCQQFKCLKSTGKQELEKRDFLVSPAYNHMAVVKPCCITMQDHWESLEEAMYRLPKAAAKVFGRMGSRVALPV
ncbi:hypothetical protein MUK42_11003 [Musa troglodytarum]|uniref:Uncharacterized protein n=1 Tax=Musa troglodytarum TaxID=320322 RepID=A0A9E7KI70_9LILI|nr:hypothetical protein MUK42_11003 [Musa troglodytarum]